MIARSLVPMWATMSFKIQAPSKSFAFRSAANRAWIVSASAAALTAGSATADFPSVGYSPTVGET